MPRSKPLLTLLTILVAFTTIALADSAHFKTLYSFKGGADSQLPVALVMDPAGNLYGITSGSIGDYCYDECGTVFELSPSSGGWKKKTLYRFTGGADGGEPVGQLVLDSAGNLYGVTSLGGSSGCAASVGCGVVFELSPNGSGWTEKTLYTFTGGADGNAPGALVQDAAGNLFGGVNSPSGQTCYTAYYGCGQIFELSHDAGGWVESTVYAFVAAGGINTLIVDQDGNIFGSTSWGGDLNSSCYTNKGCGTIFELSPTGGGWTFSNLFNFPYEPSGAGPIGPLLQDVAGHLFGTTFGGGKNCQDSCGTVYKLTNSSGTWNRNVIHQFKPSQGGAPAAGLVENRAGELFGTTFQGSDRTKCFGLGCGTVFKLTQTAAGGWSETIIHQFTGAPNGDLPLQLIIDGAGNLYGVTEFGGDTDPGCGASGCGTVFEVIP